jgi:N-methylhydantoinase A/oxoprolinase/acetone carboxylase beta subunit
VYDGDLLEAGHRIVGPALIDDRTTTVLVLEGFMCDVDAQHNLVLRSEAARLSATNAKQTAATP